MMHRPRAVSPIPTGFSATLDTRPFWEILEMTVSRTLGSVGLACLLKQRVRADPLARNAFLPISWVKALGLGSFRLGGGRRATRWSSGW